MKEKICFVVQRYGLEVNGGAELLCRQLAEKMKSLYDIEVLTTKAVDHMTWKNEYKRSEEDIHGVHVRRFRAVKTRRINKFNALNQRFLDGFMEESEQMTWLEKQGPVTPELVAYLEDHQFEYKVVIFVTYLYYPTVLGIEKMKQKCIMMPMAHDEPYIHMNIFRNVFMKPDAFFFNTEEERKFVHQKYHNEKIPSDIGGAGIEIPENVSGEKFCSKYHLGHYIIYVGRIEPAKNCNQLFQFFMEYKKRNGGDLKLVLLGKELISIPKHPDIVSLGFVSEEDKFNGIAGAKALVLPSEFESLSIVVLEAMALRTSVIVNGKCPVLKAHCIQSNGAFYYNNYFEFEGELRYLHDHPEIAEVMADNALRYVNENYQWDRIVEKLNRLICEIQD